MIGYSIMCSLHNVHEMNTCRADNDCAWFNSRTGGWILIKFGMDIIPLQATLNHTFQFPTVNNTNMEDEWTCKVAVKTAPLNIWYMIRQWCVALYLWNTCSFTYVKYAHKYKGSVLTQLHAYYRVLQRRLTPRCGQVFKNIGM